MTDREQTIATLTEHLDHWKRLLSEGICTKDEGERTIKALTFAIESIKVDRAYDLAYEKVDFIEIPEGVTFGDMIKIMFPKGRMAESEENKESIYYEIDLDEFTYCTLWFPKILWNSPYRKEQ